MAPRRNAFPMDNFFLIQISTRIKTRNTRMIAGTCSITGIRQLCIRIFTLRNQGNHIVGPWCGARFDFVTNMDLCFFKTICFEVFSNPVRRKDATVHGDVCAVGKGLYGGNCGADVKNRVG